MMEASFRKLQRESSVERRERSKTTLTTIGSLSSKICIYYAQRKGVCVSHGAKKEYFKMTS